MLGVLLAPKINKRGIFLSVTRSLVLQIEIACNVPFGLSTVIDIQVGSAATSWSGCSGSHVMIRRWF